MIYKTAIVIFSIFSTLTAFASDGFQETDNDLLRDLYQKKDYYSVEKIVLPLAEKGDPEYEWTVGFLQWVWLIDPDATKKPKHSVEDMLNWIQKSAKSNQLQAITFLYNGYKFERHFLKRNFKLELCWRDVLDRKKNGVECVRKEEEEGGFSKLKNEKEEKCWQDARDKKKSPEECEQLG